MLLLRVLVECVCVCVSVHIVRATFCNWYILWQCTSSRVVCVCSCVVRSIPVAMLRVLCAGLCRLTHCESACDERRLAMDLWSRRCGHCWCEETGPDEVCVCLRNVRLPVCRVRKALCCQSRTLPCQLCVVYHSCSFDSRQVLLILYIVLMPVYTPISCFVAFSPRGLESVRIMWKLAMCQKDTVHVWLW